MRPTVRSREEGLREGEAKGLAAGIEKGQMEITQRMKARGRPIEEIAGDTGLLEAQIREL